MGEFLNVAQMLEIKEIDKDVTFDDENTTNIKVDTSNVENDMASENETHTFDTERNGHKINNSKLFSNRDGMFVCNQCQSQFTFKATLKTHIQSIHEGQRYPCNHCDYQAITSGNLKAHIQSKHEGVKHDCNQCNYQASHKSHLSRHIQRLHGGVYSFERI